MYRLQLVLFGTFTAFIGTSTGEVVGRIIAGQDADIRQYPYQVLVNGPNNLLCGGSIIDAKVVLTTAHCIELGSRSDYSIQYGLTCIGGSDNRIKAKQLIIHGHFTRRQNDIGLIILKKAIKLGETARIIPLATEEPASGTHVIISGWGTTDAAQPNTKSENLQAVTLLTFPISTCKDQYAGHIIKIDNRNLCIGVPGGGRGFCAGDSGGPVVANGELVGIIGWSTGCAEANHHGVCTNVVAYRDWILRNMQTR